MRFAAVFLGRRLGDSMISTSLFKPGSFESRRGGLNLGSQFNFNLLSSPQDTQASERLLSVRAAVSGLLS